ncbi:hypothetical protein F2Q70_00039498 [Brassica cretica]|uniref:Uncharacterized protein n=1 Tax=Brassica cretica TaxID=69181 RepID=A0A8S9K0D8_BRACR|nr:hypothetical protein F2Q70_00039498 [Brassica cretica]
MQLDTQKHEVSQYLRSAHANRNAEVRVSRCMNTRHAEGQVDVEVSSGMARENAAGHMDTHVSPRMQPKACRTTHKRSGGSFLLAGNFYIYPATLVYFYSFRHTKDTPKLPKDCPEEKESYFRVLISPDQFIQDIEVGFLGFNITVPRRKFGGDKRGLVNIRNQRVEPHRLITDSRTSLGVSLWIRGLRRCLDFVWVLLCENLVVVLVVVCRSLLPQMPLASPIEDRGTTIPIEDRDWAILERLRLVYLVLVLFCENLVVVLVVVCRSLLPQMPPASPIEDRGTAILIEDRDRAIPKRLRLCGVIVKGLSVSLVEEE